MAAILPHGGSKGSCLSLGLLIVTSLTLPPVSAAESFPTYRLITSSDFSDSLGADIAASSFVGVEGKFHFVTSVASYAQSDDGSSFTMTFTSDDFGQLVSTFGSSTPVNNYNSYWNKTGSYCYQLDKRAINPMPSLYEDDHCDVVGIWIDPVTHAWIGIVNDEYQFNPWGPANETQNARISTGKHNNRIMLATSSDEGSTWSIDDQICTDYFQPNQTITAALFPNSTYSWGLSGARFYVDYIHGYAYALYNRQVRNKSGDATLLQAFTMARAPLANGLAPSTWRKYFNGRWDQPGIGGVDGIVGEPLGLQLNYVPEDDYIAYEGTGADGSSVSYRSTPFPSGGSFTFADGSGVTYVAYTANKTIEREDNGQTVSLVSYLDPALGRTITVGQDSSNIVVNSTDKYGVLVSFSPTTAHHVFKDSLTNRLYVQPNTLQETAFTYNVYSGRYRATGYDNYIYENDDLGKPNNWVPVGHQPAEVAQHAAYQSFLDTGSLSNQNVGSMTYAIISDLYTTMDTITQTPHSSSQTSYSVYRPPYDADGNSIASNLTYSISVGGIPLDFGSGSNWYLEPVMDAYNAEYNTGFYRLRSSANVSEYLQVPGSNPALSRQLGATVALGPAQPLYDAGGNDGYGSPGGSDQWYLLPYGNNTNQPIDPSSSQTVVDNAQNTSLLNAAGYKLVNRNSALVLGVDGSKYVLTFNSFAQNQAVALTVQKAIDMGR